MSTGAKIDPAQLNQKVCIYIRQSSMVQVQEHQESTHRQYGLRSRALALGWREEQIVVIDEDLGHSATDASKVRVGYQRLMSEIVSGQVGAVLSLEISRLARQDSEGYRLVEVAALMGTLLVDESQVYDPRLADDRLMLGLKVLLSSNEIRLMRQRLQENKVRKAQRGELRLELPVGLVNESRGRVILDPNEAVQGAVRLVFERFRVSGQQSDVVRYFTEHNLMFPRRRGNWNGPLEWGRLSIQRVHYILANPLYAGAYVYGRTELLTQAAENGQITRKPRERAQEKWLSVEWDAFAGYIDRIEYESNLQRLKNHPSRHRRKDGSALLSGMLVCGRCGKRMYVYYNGDDGRFSTYICCANQARYAEAACQRIPAPKIDKAVAERLLEALSPAQIEVSLAALVELEQQQHTLHKQWQRQLEGARYAASLAQRRYEQVDPENRLVARQLELRWEQQLLEVTRLEADYSRFCQEQPLHLTVVQRQRLLDLAQDFPRLWQAETTTSAQRKNLIESLIADVTLTRQTDCVRVQIRWHTNQVETLEVPLPVLGSPKTPVNIIERIHALTPTHSNEQIADILNQEGMQTAYGNMFTKQIVASTR